MRHTHSNRLDSEPKEESPHLCNQRRLKGRNTRIANKHSTHPLAIDTRRKTTELRNDTSVTLHWVKEHSGLKGNENSSELQTYHHHLRRNTGVARQAVTGRIQYKNLECDIYKFRERLPHQNTHSLNTPQNDPNPLAKTRPSQFLTNHGSFRSYLYKRKKEPTPLCSCPKKAAQTAQHLEVCHPHCVKSNITVSNMYVLTYIFSQKHNI